MASKLLATDVTFRFKSRRWTDKPLRSPEEQAGRMNLHWSDGTSDFTYCYRTDEAIAAAIVKLINRKLKGQPSVRKD